MPVTIEKTITEIDPSGKCQHDLGAKLDAHKPELALVLYGFSNALLQVSNVGSFGAKKYTPNGWKYVHDGINRYKSAMLRQC